MSDCAHAFVVISCAASNFLMRIWRVESIVAFLAVSAQELLCKDDDTTRRGLDIIFIRKDTNAIALKKVAGQKLLEQVLSANESQIEKKHEYKLLEEAEEQRRLGYLIDKEERENALRLFPLAYPF